jgi:methylmalonyl-CoA mutase
VNTFLAKNAGEASIPREIEIRRASYEEKNDCIRRLRAFHAAHASEAPAALKRLQEVALSGQNLFAELVRATEVCSLGQITHALYEVGGQYRRNL